MKQSHRHGAARKHVAHRYSAAAHYFGRMKDFLPGIEHKKVAVHYLARARPRSDSMCKGTEKRTMQRLSPTRHRNGASDYAARAGTGSAHLTEPLEVRVCRPMVAGFTSTRGTVFERL
jgi:hypothetical protein